METRRKKDVAQKKYCDVEGCGNEIPEGRGSHGGLECCDGCLSARYYWRKKGPKALEARKERLLFFVDRADYLMPLVGKMLKQARAKVEAAKARAANVQ
jgi:hypothetical protein